MSEFDDHFPAAEKHDFGFRLETRHLGVQGEEYNTGRNDRDQENQSTGTLKNWDYVDGEWVNPDLED
jgi:hypothetical protein